MQVSMRVVECVCVHRCTSVRMSGRVHAEECVCAPSVFSVGVCIDLCLYFHVHMHRHKGDELGCAWRWIFVDLWAGV